MRARQGIDRGQLTIHAEHQLSSLGLLTPADVHQGLAEQRIAARVTVLATALDVIAVPRSAWIVS
jgi:hypothetical protein